MNKTAHRHAWENFHEAKAAHARLTQASSQDETERAWAVFLASMGTAFNKLEAGAKGNPKTDHWLGPIRHERKTDPLLVYIHHARNSREHGLTEVTEQVPSSFAITGDMYIEHLEVGPGGLRGLIHGINPARPVGRRFEPARVRLVSVVDCKQVYDPPTSHLGVAVEGTSPHAVAALALAYVERVLKEAGAYIQP